MFNLGPQTALFILFIMNDIIVILLDLLLQK